MTKKYNRLERVLIKFREHAMIKIWNHNIYGTTYKISTNKTNIFINLIKFLIFNSSFWVIFFRVDFDIIT